MKFVQFNIFDNEKLVTLNKSTSSHSKTHRQEKRTANSHSQTRTRTKTNTNRRTNEDEHKQTNERRRTQTDERTKTNTNRRTNLGGTYGTVYSPVTRGTTTSRSTREVVKKAGRHHASPETSFHASSMSRTFSRRARRTSLFGNCAATINALIIDAVRGHYAFFWQNQLQMCDTGFHS